MLCCAAGFRKRLESSGSANSLDCEEVEENEKAFFGTKGVLLLELADERESRFAQSRGAYFAYRHFLLLPILLHTLLFDVAILYHNRLDIKMPFLAEKGKTLDLRYHESLE